MRYVPATFRIREDVIIEPLVGVFLVDVLPFACHVAEVVQIFP